MIKKYLLIIILKFPHERPQEMNWATFEAEDYLEAHNKGGDIFADFIAKVQPIPARRWYYWDLVELDPTKPAPVCYGGTK